MHLLSFNVDVLQLLGHAFGHPAKLFQRFGKAQATISPATYDNELACLGDVDAGIRPVSSAMRGWPVR